MFEAAGAVISGVLGAGVPIYTAGLIGTGLLLFLPASVANQIGIDEFRHLYKGYLGGGFIASISLLIAYSLNAIKAVISNWLDNRRFSKNVLKSLKALTASVKMFLSPFIRSGQNTVNSSIGDGVSGGLVAKNIIYRSSNIIEYFKSPFNLQPIARKLLTKNPSLLD